LCPPPPRIQYVRPELADIGAFFPLPRFLKDYSQEINTERKLNCNRTLQGAEKSKKLSGFKIRPTREVASRNSAPKVQ
jgi:hypothetical protein